jgi:DNA-binding response OmpR family regulator
MPEATLRSTRTLLVVEDDAVYRTMTVHMLTKAGFQVIEATDGEEALRLATDRHPDLILLDLKIPKVVGFQVLLRLKENLVTAHIPVLVLSALQGDAEFQQALQYGAAEYMVKFPMNYQELLDRVDELLERP